MNFLNKITIGQYIPLDSYIHRLDPRIKITILCGFMIWTILTKNLSYYIIPAIVLFLIILISGIPFKYLLKNIFALKYLFIFTCIFHFFFTEGTAWWKWKFLTITFEGINTGTLVTLRLLYLIASASLLTLTTSPVQITDAFENIFYPFKFLGFPAHEIAMMLTISFRFIPILFMEINKIMKAQMCRGVDFSNGNLIDRINNLITIIVPLFLSSFHRAEELAQAMDARGYRGGEGRSHFRELKITLIDYLTIILIITITLFSWWFFHYI
ncbi:MAG: energy-coupling factor transporter transmembrane protein EcfT [Candidatus Firestonebacteria bacterium]|nr:energy-coupling factor transporter transmembrane protein EcfT [Candidatus Firestonebacteria bacterium]